MAGGTQPVGAMHVVRALLWKEARAMAPTLAVGVVHLLVMPAVIAFALGTAAGGACRLLAIVVAGVALAGSLFAAESNGGTEGFLLGLPAPRRTVWRVKVFTLAAALLVVAAFVPLGTALHAPPMPGLAGRFVGDWISTVCLLLMTTACCVLASTVIDQPLTAALAGMVGSGALLMISAGVGRTLDRVLLEHVGLHGLMYSPAIVAPVALAGIVLALWASAKVFAGKDARR